MRFRSNEIWTDEIWQILWKIYDFLVLRTFSFACFFLLWIAIISGNYSQKMMKITGNSLVIPRKTLSGNQLTFSTRHVYIFAVCQKIFIFYLQFKISRKQHAIEKCDRYWFFYDVGKFIEALVSGRYVCLTEFPDIICFS